MGGAEGAKSTHIERQRIDWTGRAPGLTGTEPRFGAAGAFAYGDLRSPAQIHSGSRPRPRWEPELVRTSRLLKKALSA